MRSSSMRSMSPMRWTPICLPAPMHGQLHALHALHTLQLHALHALHALDTRLPACSDARTAPCCTACAHALSSPPQPQQHTCMHTHTRARTHTHTHARTGASVRTCEVVAGLGARRKQDVLPLCGRARQRVAPHHQLRHRGRQPEAVARHKLLRTTSSQRQLLSHQLPHCGNGYHHTSPGPQALQACCTPTTAASTWPCTMRKHVHAHANTHSRVHVHAQPQAHAPQMLHRPKALRGCKAR